MLTTIKVYACYTVTTYKNISKGGCTGPWSAFDIHIHV